MRDRGKCLYDEAGRAVRVLGAVSDITERVRAERELAEKEAQLRLTLSHMPGGIRLVDKDRNYVFFNSQYCGLKNT